MDVQLYQRQELPPTRVGAVKPEHIPELGVGEVIAGFAGTVFDKIWATRAANEESEYVGSIETALGEFETAVADSPGMSPENLKKLKDATLAKIDDFSKLATLPKSKQYIKDFALKNRGRIGARLNTSVEEIITEQELGRAKINLDMLVAARDSAGVTKLFFGTETKPQGLSGTLIDPETATLMHAAAQDKINVLQSKFDAGEAQADAFDIWQDTITEENPEGDLTKAFEFINADPRIPESDKQEAESELRMRVYNRRAEDERINEEKREADRDIVSKAIQSADPNVLTTIDNSSLDEAEQYTWSQRAKAEADRRSKGVDIVTDPELRSNLYSGIFEVLTGAKTKKQVLDEAKAARFPGMDKDGKPIPPKLDDDEYQSFEKSINAQYEEAYKFNMGKVSRHAEGTLLNPDSLGYIKNAPIRYKILGDFNKSFLAWIQSKGDKLLIPDIYIEGMKMVSMFQISDAEAERQEIEMTEKLESREAREAREASLVKTTKPGFLGRKESEFPKGFQPVEATEPKTRNEFKNTLRRLQMEDYKKATEYYHKYLDRFY